MIRLSVTWTPRGGGEVGFTACGPDVPAALEHARSKWDWACRVAASHNGAGAADMDALWSALEHVASDLPRGTCARCATAGPFRPLGGVRISAARG